MFFLHLQSRLPSLNLGRSNTKQTDNWRRHAIRQHTKQVCCLSGHTVGIDLGTTNSAVAVVENGVPRVIATSDGRTTPSVVHIKSDGTALVGRAAKKTAAQEPHSTFFSTKRLIGRRHKAVQHASQKLPYSITSDDSGNVVLHSGSRNLLPEDIAAHLLRFLLTAAEADLGSPISRAVISVPAYFDQEQRQATIAAGRLAGLETVKLIREPVAAALAYGLDLQQEATVLVVDLGGGTYDVALLEIGGGTVEVLTTGGDATLGGDDWDAAIAKHLVTNHLQPAGISIRTPASRARLRIIAESAKIALSDHSEVLLRVPAGGSRGKPPLKIVLTEQQLDKLTAPLYRKALLPLEDACQQAGVDLEAALKSAARDRGGAGGGRKISRRRKAKTPLDVELRPKMRAPISEVLMVGGATRMPAFSRFISNATGLQPRRNVVDPDEAVAVGAAIQAAMLSGQLDDLMVMDVWQAALMRAFASPALQNMGQEDRESIEGLPHDEFEEHWQLESETFEEAMPQEGEVFDEELTAELKAEAKAEAEAKVETTVDVEAAV